MNKPNPPLSPARVLLPLGLGTAFSLMGDSTMYAVLPTHTAEAGVTLASVGIILSVNRAVRIFLNGPAGLAYDRWPRRWLFVPALFVGALSTALYAATRGLWPLLAGRLLWGLAWSGIWIGGATVVLDVTTVEDRGRWMGLYQTYFFLGAGLGAFAGGALTDTVGYTNAMWIAAGLTAVGGLVAWLWLPETRAARTAAGAPAAEGAAEEDDLGETPAEAASPHVSRFTFHARPRAGRGLGAAAASSHVSRFTLHALWVAAAWQGINRFAISGVLGATLGLVVQEHWQSTRWGLGVATLTGALAAGRTLFSMAAAPLAGVASDRVGSRSNVVGWGLGVGVASMALMAWGTPAAILVGVSLGAVTNGSVQGLTGALAGDLAGQAQRGRAVGLVNTAGDLGSALGPPIAYALLPGMGLPGVYLLCAGLFVAGCVLALNGTRINADGTD